MWEKTGAADVVTEWIRSGFQEQNIENVEMWKQPGQMSKKMGAVNTICFAILGADKHSRQKQFGFPGADVHSIQ